MNRGAAGPPTDGPVDVAIVGGGIVGLFAARRIHERAPDRKVVVLEKEDGLARHQTGRSSGVVHSGVYYPPGSLKARLCVTGRRDLLAFCEAEGLPVRLGGKVIVATRPAEVPRLNALAAQGAANGVDCEVISAQRLAEIEPHVRGVAALHVPGAGVVDFKAVAARVAAQLEAVGAQVATRAEVTAIRNLGGTRILSTPRGPVEASLVLACPGLQSDRVAAMAGLEPDVRIVPFRGVFHRLRPEAAGLCRSLVYPVPDPALPFLGVHLTRTLEGEILCGPGAVPALAREGYGLLDVDGTDLREALSWPGTRRLLRRHLRTGIKEAVRATSRAAFARAVRRLVPAVRARDLLPAPHGLRAQAVDAKGRLVDDFVIEEAPGLIAVLNAPSPAATAAPAIGAVIADRALARISG